MTHEQEQFIINNWNKMSCEDLRKKFNNEYETQYKTTAFHYHTKRLGLMKHIEHKYTKEEDEFLENNSCVMTRKELTDLFNKTFDARVKQQAIEQRCFLKGFKPKDDGKFKKGGTPWCKTCGGREEYIKTLKGGNRTSFKKGNIPHNIQKIGTVKFWGHNLRIKTDSGWDNKLRYVWRKEKGEIPKGYVVISVNGNYFTNNIAELRLIPNKTLTVLMSNKWIGKGEVIVDTGIVWSKLREAIKLE